MGLGVSLALMAIGAILAFATRFTLSGINIQMIGWILMLIALVNWAFTLLYTRPRRRAAVTEVEEPVYVADPIDPVPPTPHAPAEAGIVEEPVDGSGTTIREPGDVVQPGDVVLPADAVQSGNVVRPARRVRQGRPQPGRYLRQALRRRV